MSEKMAVISIEPKCPLHNEKLDHLYDDGDDSYYVCRRAEDGIRNPYKRSYVFIDTHIVKLSAEGTFYQPMGWKSIEKG